MPRGAQLASPAIFGTHEMKEKIKVGASNKEVLDVIRKKADEAIDNTFNILRTRIDRFGVAQPNIRKLTSPEESLSSCRVSRNRNV